MTAAGNFLRIDRLLWPAVALLAVLFIAFECTGLDLWVQDRLYDFAAHAWAVNAKAPVPRLLFYTGPKMLIIALGAGLVVLAVGPADWRTRWALRRRDLWVAVAVLASAPALVAASKATTNIFCPYEIRRYGGNAPYVRVLETYPEGDRPAKRGRGFPAGHASGGFALLGLAGLAQSRRGRIAGIVAGLAAGWAMGGYQMLRGAHYLSHTVITMMVCWIVFLLWRRVLRATDNAASAA